MDEIKTIGFDKKILYPWMDATAYWASQGLPTKEIRGNLDSLLKSRLAHTGTRSSMSKVRSILMRIWVQQDDGLQDLRKDAYALYPHTNGDEKLLLHWGLSAAAYPFFYQVAEHTGRLLAIRQEIRSRQVLRRLKERYGERSTLEYAAQRVVRSFVEWGVLENSTKHVVLKDLLEKNNNYVYNYSV